MYIHIYLHMYYQISVGDDEVARICFAGKKMKHAVIK